ncbi:MAG TPA: DUF4139 domain-containing protein [Fimbriimonas sp.]|nr:DUF4139 domain-containing protein [Fimbriimonas sp.]
MATSATSGCSRAVAASPETVPASEYTLTIYKDDFAMVHDLRQVNVGNGASELRLPGVSKQLDPSSVLFDWPGSGPQPEVVSTMYNVGVTSSQELLKRMVGQDVTVVYRGQNGEPGDKAEGRLEEANQGTVLHTKDSYIIDPSGEIHAPADKQIVTMPELVASVQSQSAGQRQVGLSYLTRGLSWSADYVGLLTPDGKTMRLECWGTIDNQTGTNFDHAALRLVAGSPNRAVQNQVALHQEMPMQVNESRITDGALSGGVMAKMPAPVQVAGDLYTYKLPDTASIEQGQMNRARIATAEQVPITRTYNVSLSEDVPGIQQRIPAQTTIAFLNSQSGGLGIPLPSGTLRAYESDEGVRSYIGASEIADTPKSQRLSLTLSNAFDVFTRANLDSSRRLGKHKTERTYTIELHNEKSKEVDMKVTQSFYEAVQLGEQSVKPNKADSSTLEWRLKVPAKGVLKLRSEVFLNR